MRNFIREDKTSDALNRFNSTNIIVRDDLQLYGVGWIPKDRANVMNKLCVDNFLRNLESSTHSFFDGVFEI